MCLQIIFYQINLSWVSPCIFVQLYWYFGIISEFWALFWSGQRFLVFSLSLSDLYIISIFTIKTSLIRFWVTQKVNRRQSWVTKDIIGVDDVIGTTFLSLPSCAGLFLSGYKFRISIIFWSGEQIIKVIMIAIYNYNYITVVR